jgi:hypothetical protein
LPSIHPTKTMAGNTTRRNGPWDGKALGAAVPVHDMRNIKQRHATGLTRVGDRENTLQEAIEIGDGNDTASDLERLVFGVPPAMGNTRRKYSGLTGSHLDGLRANDGAQHASHDLAFLALDHVNVQRRAFPVGRSTPLKFEDDLIAVAHAAHDQDFTCVAVFQAKCAGCGTCKVRRSAHVAPKDTRLSWPGRLGSFNCTVAEYSVDLSLGSASAASCHCPACILKMLPTY